jgi:hypothetical protein
LRPNEPRFITTFWIFSPINLASTLFTAIEDPTIKISHWDEFSLSQRIFSLKDSLEEMRGAGKELENKLIIKKVIPNKIKIVKSRNKIYFLNL